MCKETPRAACLSQLSFNKAARHPARAAQGCLAYPRMHASSKLCSWEEGMFRKPRTTLFPHFHTNRCTKIVIMKDLLVCHKLSVGQNIWKGEYLTLGFERAQAIRQRLSGPGKPSSANARGVFEWVPQYHAVSWATECSKPSAGALGRSLQSCWGKNLTNCFLTHKGYDRNKGLTQHPSLCKT